MHPGNLSRQLARAYLVLLFVFAVVSLPPWPKSEPLSTLNQWHWVVSSARFQLFDVVCASFLALSIGLFTSLRALNRNEATPPLGRVQQIAFALPFLLLIAVWRTRSGSDASRLDVPIVAGLLQGLSLGRHLCERALAADSHLYLAEPDAPRLGSLLHLWRQQGFCIRLSAARLSLTCIALDALSARLGFGRSEPLTWGDLVGAVSPGTMPPAVTAFSVFGILTLPWALFALGFHSATSRQAR
jgi:hypothetical protein